MWYACIISKDEVTKVRYLLSLRGWQMGESWMMPADEFKLVLRYMSILEAEAIKNRCELKLDFFTYGTGFLPDMGSFVLN